MSIHKRVNLESHESPSRSVTLSLLNHRRPTVVDHQDTVVTAVSTVVSDDAGATSLRHFGPVQLLPVRSESVTTQPVRSSHRLDRRPDFMYGARFDQFLGLGLDFGLSGPTYDLRSNFQGQLAIGSIV
ncbi:hypothetical protein PVK06_024456 [Gossypium arboreum]|uniref:Uncharacterized protein n=1 Tax=Gossypium arboreum TaxID=29729 RepID=A0ABR0PE58_GOSAR|nr:hypothetical protein PVK06_024456 [Gossypium arboreum]